MMGSGESRVGLKVSKTCKFKWLVKVSASIYQTPDLKKILAGGGGPGSEKNPGYPTDGIIVVFDTDKDSSSSST